MNTQNTPTNTKTYIKTYTSAFGDLVSLLPDCGVFKVNHVMVAMAIIGVLPLWYYSYYHGLNRTDDINYLKIFVTKNNQQWLSSSSFIQSRHLQLSTEKKLQ